MKEEFEARFRSYPSTDPKRNDVHLHVRAKARDFAEVLAKWCPEGRELSLALTHVEEAMMWANIGIARTWDGAK